MTNRTDTAPLPLVPVGESTYATRVLAPAEPGPCELKVDPSGRVTLTQYGREIVSAQRVQDLGRPPL